MEKYIQYVHNVGEYWQYKVVAGLWAAFWSDELPILFLLFVGLELMDIFTRWLALTADWYKKTYPQSRGNLYIYLTWMWQARKWKWIKSDGLREGFCNKCMVYLVLLLLAGTVDAALSISHVPRVMLSIVTTVLASTEALSICENLSECNVTVIKQIRDKFKDKIEKVV